MRKLCIAALALVLAMGLAVCAHAEEEHVWRGNVCLQCGEVREIPQSGEWLYVAADDGKSVEIAGYDGTDTQITIPAQLDGKPVTAIGAFVFQYCSELESVIIPDGVTSIGDYAFNGAFMLRSVSLPDSLSTIGDHAFSYCINLENIALPDSISSIGRNPFYGCLSVKFTISPRHPYLALIDDVLFEKLNKRLVAYPSLSSASTYEIPNGILEIDDWAFYRSDNLTSILIPDSVVSIGDFAFYECQNLQSILIPNSVSSIGANPFCNTPADITVSPRHPYFAVIDGVLFEKQSKKLVTYSLGREESVYEIPDGILEIGQNAFSYNMNLESVCIPDTVTAIDANAFAYSWSLNSIFIPGSVTSIGSGAFRGCSALSGITIPESVTSIGPAAFQRCDALTDITIPGSVSTIEAGTFAACQNLTNVVISDGVTSIEMYAFQLCESLESVTIPESVTYIGPGAFDGCGDLVFSVPMDSYADQYCVDNGLNYTFTNALDWLFN